MNEGKFAMIACRTAALPVLLILTLLLASAAGSPANARQAEIAPATEDAPTDPAIADDVVSLTNMIAEKAMGLAELLGVSAPPIPRNALTAGLMAAMPMLPRGDQRTWATSVAVDFVTDTVTNSPLQPNADGYVVQRDARECVPSTTTWPWIIVDFRRLDQPGLTGHQCIVAALNEADLWMIHSTTVVEGVDRRLVATYYMAVTVEGRPADSTALGEARIPANVALARGIADYGVALLKQAETGRRTDPAETLERLGRWAETMQEP